MISFSGKQCIRLTFNISKTFLRCEKCGSFMLDFF